MVPLGKHIIIEILGTDNSFNQFLASTPPPIIAVRVIKSSTDLEDPPKIGATLYCYRKKIIEINNTKLINIDNCILLHENN